MARYMIRCDMEGVSGVVSYEQAEPGGSEYEFGNRMFMADLLAALEGLKAGGADEVVIYDEHYYGRNIDIAQLPEYAKAICGKPPYRPNWAGGLDETFAGVILLGLHSKAGTAGGLLPHSYELDIAELLLNGVSVGEIGMEAAIAGDFNVPVVLVTGDSAGVKEAQELLSGVEAVSVKESISESAGLCYPLATTSEAIRSKAAAIVRKKPAAAAYKVGNEVKLEVQLNEGPYLQAAQRLLKGDMSDDKTVQLSGGSATEVWADYWQKKLRCQAWLEKIEP